MSRSRRKTAITGIASCNNRVSEKQDKRRNNRCMRRTNKARLADGLEPVMMKEVSDPWGMAKDGKFWFGDWEEDREKLMRK